MKSQTAFFAPLVTWAIAGTCLALPLTPPTEEQVTSAISEFNSKVRDLKPTDGGVRTKAAEDAVRSLGVSELSIEQIERLKDLRILDQAPGVFVEVRERLNMLGKDSTGAGARAAVLAIDYTPRPARDAKPSELAEYQKAQADGAVAALMHPGLHEAFMAGKGAGLFNSIGQVNQASMDHETLEKAIEAGAKAVTLDVPPLIAARSQYLFDFASDEDSKLDPAKVQAIRGRLLAAVDASAAALKPEDEKLKPTLARTHKYLDGAFARGELVGHAAPELNIKWSNLKTPVSKLSDLKGKVVVLDFWATWCGPCIGSFPKVRDLQEHYKDSPVVILGVTSLQGFHIDQKATDPKNRRIDCKDDPAKEMGLMPEFIKAMDMTWNVAFTDQEVFNPDYGIRGIPHVVIIDPNGVVRYRGLHPSSDPAGKIHKIDGLLVEFKLPVPPADKTVDPGHAQVTPTGGG